MDEPLFEEPAAPKPKRKYTRRKKFTRPPALRIVPNPAQDLKTGLYAGVTAALCCADCTAAGCVISGDVCVHPYKGGLQSAHRMRPDVLKRFEEVKQILRHQAVEKERA